MSDDEVVGPREERSRRSLLKLAAAGLAGLLGSAAARPSAALAADGNAIVAGAATTAQSKTTLTSSFATPNNGAFVVDAQGADWAIEGNSGQLGVLGSGFVGVTGTGTIGGYFSGTLNAISLEPQTAVGPPTSTDCARGDMLVDATGVLYLCVADGNPNAAPPSPGTWIRVSHGGVRLLSSPARAYDSRSDPAGPLRSGSGDVSGSPRTIDVLGAVPNIIPAGALGIVGNLAVTQAAAGGFATIWPGGSWPGTANINFTSVDLSNSFSVGLSGGTVAIGSSAQTHVILDVTGYVL